MKTLNNLKIRATMIAALIPNIKMLITMGQYQLIFPSSGNYCTGGENKAKKNKLHL